MGAEAPPTTDFVAAQSFVGGASAPIPSAQIARPQSASKARKVRPYRAAIASRSR
ncbi:hypothetical protein [Lysobacter gummosus]|uniref:hypothetical protein n=1 Tax=Lysobacter gummosus TaxID=262324 RepID=UPI00363F7F5F